MGFFKQPSDIISSNLNEFIKQHDNPEEVYLQAIQEMEESVSKMTDEAAEAVANEKRLYRELNRNEWQRNQWQVRATMAVRAGDDELARKALRRRSEHARMTAALDEQAESARENSVMLKLQLDAMKAKLAEATQDFSSLKARKRAGERSVTPLKGDAPEQEPAIVAELAALRKALREAGIGEDSL